MTDFKLAGRWEQKHTKVLLDLKVALMSQPMLHAPQYDGTPFVITMDSVSQRFGTVLTQQSKVQAPNSKTVE
ncbi:hypothetical protein BKA82DRAFT_148997 [Pisolithus tinctorius]|uniref:Reverse transcriptase/retrotransposon-derived protein RNase H-like domain-containing protein n=1 Tax=Pisolithus tinctorius Marx 270 TaxID=870435 RepID=A0A0C3JWS2_PISTI|nr:hypothetical protein BKA82DRAFT_148997 [Pisolithus tinctorius]KIO01837.1 hypothetical protein M404DRAFT_148997 [Pisolithus tinctorius Marx 270]